MKLKIAAFTLLEVGAIAALLIDSRWGWVLVAVLFAAEHLVSWNARRLGRGLFEVDGAPVEKLAVVAALEAATWIVWFRMASMGDGWVAAVVLAIGLIIGHVLERNTSAGLPLLRDVGRRIRESLDFTVLEVVGGIGWLALLKVDGLVAALALFVFLFAEHTVSVNRLVKGGH